MKTKTNFNTVDEYINTFPEDVQAVLEQDRSTIKSIAPEAEEKISYAMPAFSINGRQLVYFAAFKNHIGFYPLPNGMKNFKKEFEGYKTGKGSVQFPLDKPIPLPLIKKIVKFRRQVLKTKEKE